MQSISGLSSYAFPALTSETDLTTPQADSDLNSPLVRVNELCVDGHIVIANRPCKIQQICDAVGSSGFCTEITGKDVFSHEIMLLRLPPDAMVAVPQVTSYDLKVVRFDSHNDLLLRDDSSAELISDVTFYNHGLAKVALDFFGSVHKLQVTVVCALGSKHIISIKYPQ